MNPITNHTEYIEAVDATIGVRLPRAYLAQGRSTGLTQRQRLVGGFTVITEAPFRSLLQLPARSRSTLEATLLRLGGRVVEANGLFLLPQVRTPSTIVCFWRGLVEALKRADATFVLFSYSASSQKLARFYAPVRPISLYCGPVGVIEGMRAPDVERVCLTTVTQIERITTSNTWLTQRISGRAEASL